MPPVFFSLQQLKLFHAIEKGKRAKVIKGTKDRPSAKSLKRVVTPGSSSSLLTVVAAVGLLDWGEH